MAFCKLDPRDYKFCKIDDNDNLVKLPGAINGQGFKLEDLNRCEVLLLDHSSQVTVDFCSNCKILIGPCSGSVFLRDCTDCSFIVACRQFRTRNLKRCTFNLFCSDQPSIEYSTELVFAQWNVAYPRLTSQFAAARLDPTKNKWFNVYDFSKEPNAYTLDPTPPQVHSLDTFSQEFGPAENPVLFSSPDGGVESSALASDASPSGIVSFPLGTPAHEAEAVLRNVASSTSHTTSSSATVPATPPCTNTTTTTTSGALASTSPAPARAPAAAQHAPGGPSSNSDFPDPSDSAAVLARMSSLISTIQDNTSKIRQALAKLKAGFSATSP